jgi:hypothetical protein
MGLMRMLCVGLRLATDLTGLKLPAAVEKEIRSQPRLTLVTEQMRRRMFASDDQGAGTVGMTWLQLKMRERLQDKLRYGYRLILMTKLIDSLFMPMGRPR